MTWPLLIVFRLFGSFITKHFFMVHQNLLSWRHLFVFQVFGYFLSQKKEIKMCWIMITINNLPLKILINHSKSYKHLIYFAVVVSIQLATLFYSASKSFDMMTSVCLPTLWILFILKQTEILINNCFSYLALLC